MTTARTRIGAVASQSPARLRGREGRRGSPPAGWLATQSRRSATRTFLMGLSYPAGSDGREMTSSRTRATARRSPDGSSATCIQVRSFAAPPRDGCALIVQLVSDPSDATPARLPQAYARVKRDDGRLVGCPCGARPYATFGTEVAVHRRTTHSTRPALRPELAVATLSLGCHAHVTAGDRAMCYL
jgi:hypothetical protein